MTIFFISGRQRSVCRSNDYVLNFRPPKGMYINHDDLVALATGPSVQGEQILKSMEREIVSYKRVVSWTILLII